MSRLGLATFGWALSALLVLPQCGSDPELITPNDRGMGGGPGTSPDGIGGSSSSKGGQPPIRPPGGDAGAGNVGGDGGACTDCEPVERLCGNGELDEDEECDDGNSRPGDGCSGICTQEPNYNCPTPGERCVSTIRCGDGVLGGQEHCDDGNEESGDGCSDECVVEPGWGCAVPGEPCTPVATAECGDGVVNAGEVCDDGNTNPNDGCTDECEVTPGYTCSIPGEPCVLTDFCGDGEVTLLLGEECDDGNAEGGDGCSAQCRVEANYRCPEPGEPCVSTVVCGDRRVEGDETCDDGNDPPKSGDGCSARCELEPGWECPPGAACRPICGDGIVVGREQCDDGDLDNGDGCSSLCQLEPGWACSGEPSTCKKTVCGDGVREGLEPCDDGNNDLGDGCTPFCEIEPDCSGGECVSACGDGIRLSSDDEECDDGNTVSGDGCSADCKLEPTSGYECEHQPIANESIELPLVIRDFRASSKVADDPPGFPAGHPDFEQPFIATSQGLVLPLLDDEGKPRRNPNPSGTPVAIRGTISAPIITSDASFYDWYRDSDRNTTILQRMVLQRRQDGSYEFDRPDDLMNATDGFFPIDDEGFGVDGSTPARNFHFTSEVRYWFEYRGGEVLNFRGDDDVWVFIKGQLALDLGGVHSALEGTMTLDGGRATTRTQVHTSATQVATVNGELDLDLEEGKVYEIVVFQAERHTSESSYRLTLTGFNADRTVCRPECGNGIVTPDEACDDGTNDGSYGGCNPDCTLAPYCGDGEVNGPEECDLGLNVDVYATTPDACAPGCVKPPYCGDGVVQGAFEACDAGEENSADAYGENACTDLCRPAPYCGDRRVDEAFGEVCDDGPDNGSGLPGSCEAGCGGRVPLPTCGDGRLDPGEQCDEGDENGAEGGVCDALCRWACGNGIKDPGEECDDGVNDGSYGTCNEDCTLAPYCGDGKKNGPEECDEGDDNEEDPYGKGACTTSCTRAPYCGDGRVQERFGEECDGGPRCTSACRSAIPE
ncbi:MAG: DUF4215 domain-containing protein [Pseudomonadota bacterium]|nr:MAG: hypothetical protein DIU78_00035 [Pseudomonadota bacterium]